MVGASLKAVAPPPAIKQASLLGLGSGGSQSSGSDTQIQKLIHKVAVDCINTSMFIPVMPTGLVMLVKDAKDTGVAQSYYPTCVEAACGYVLLNVYYDLCQKEPKQRPYGGELIDKERIRSKLIE